MEDVQLVRVLIEHGSGATCCCPVLRRLVSREKPKHRPFSKSFDNTLFRPSSQLRQGSCPCVAGFAAAQCGPDTFNCTYEEDGCYLFDVLNDGYVHCLRDGLDETREAFAFHPQKGLVLFAGQKENEKNSSSIARSRKSDFVMAFWLLVRSN